MRNRKAVKVGEIDNLRAVRDHLAKAAPVDIDVSERHAADFALRIVGGMVQVPGARVMTPVQIQRCRIVAAAVGAFSGLMRAGHDPKLGAAPTGLLITWDGGESAIQFPAHADDHAGLADEVLQALAAEGVYLHAEETEEIETETED